MEKDVDWGGVWGEPEGRDSMRRAILAANRYILRVR